MNKIKVCLMLALITILCCACQSTTELGEEDTLATSKEVFAEKIVSEINGFIKADYGLYTSSSLTESEISKEIYVEGTVEKCMECDSVLGFGLKDDEGNLWMVGIGNEPIYSEKTVEALVGQEVIVFGSYWTCLENGVPAIKIDDEGSCIQVPSKNAEMHLADFIADRDEVLLWFEENTNEIFCDASHADIKNGAGTYAMSTGIVERVTDYSTGDYWIDFFQKTEDGYIKSYIDYDEVYYDDIKDALNFSYGDGIRFYYYINELNDTEIYAIEKVDAGFTIENIVEDYKSSCQEYTYEKIARNPENVRGEYAQVTGKVIQVIESYGFIYLRINITKTEYGNYKDTIYVSYRYTSDTEDRILEDDIITVFGKLTGTETYKSVLGVSITLPRISGEYIEILTE